MLLDSGYNIFNCWCVHSNTVVQSPARRDHNLWGNRQPAWITSPWVSAIKKYERSDWNELSGARFSISCWQRAPGAIFCCTMYIPPSLSFWYTNHLRSLLEILVQIDGWKFAHTVDVIGMIFPQYLLVFVGIKQIELHAQGREGHEGHRGGNEGHRRRDQVELGRADGPDAIDRIGHLGQHAEPDAALVHRATGGAVRPRAGCVRCLLLWEFASPVLRLKSKRGECKIRTRYCKSLQTLCVILLTWRGRGALGIFNFWDTRI